MAIPQAAMFGIAANSFRKFLFYRVIAAAGIKELPTDDKIDAMKRIVNSL